jgi:hypothetical protein
VLCNEVLENTAAYGLLDLLGIAARQRFIIAEGAAHQRRSATVGGSVESTRVANRGSALAPDPPALDPALAPGGDLLLIIVGVRGKVSANSVARGRPSSNPATTTSTPEQSTSIACRPPSRPSIVGQPRDVRRPGVVSSPARRLRSTGWPSGLRCGAMGSWPWTPTPASC